MDKCGCVVNMAIYVSKTDYDEARAECSRWKNRFEQCSRSVNRVTARSARLVEALRRIDIDPKVDCQDRTAPENTCYLIARKALTAYEADSGKACPECGGKDRDCTWEPDSGKGEG